MRTKEADPAAASIRSAEKSFRSTSAEEGGNSQIDPKKLSRKLESGGAGDRKCSPSGKLASFTLLRHELSSIKNEVNELLNDGPIRNSEGKVRGRPALQTDLSWKDQARELSEVRTSGRSNISTTDDGASVKSAEAHSELEVLRKQLHLGQARENKLMVQKKCLLEQLLALEKQCQQLRGAADARIQLEQAARDQERQRQEKIHIPQPAEELLNLKAQNEQLLAENARLRNELEKREGQYQRKVLKMNEKMNKYIAELRENYEREFRERERERGRQSCKTVEASLHQSCHELTKLKSEAKCKDREMAMMIAETKKAKAREKMLCTAQAMLDRHRSQIEQLNRQIMAEGAARLSHKYAQLETAHFE